MMKGIIAAFILSMAGTAQAQERLDLRFQSVPNECAQYLGSFDKDGHAGAYRGSQPKLACRLLDGVGARCALKDHGIRGLENPLPFAGDFLIQEDSIIVETKHEVLVLRLICENGVCIFQLWNSITMAGYSCNLEPWKD
jgi:hypothetical protein